MLPMSSNLNWICEVKIVIEIQCKHILSCPVSLSINVASPNEFCHGIVSVSNAVSHYFGIVATFPLSALSRLSHAMPILSPAVWKLRLQNSVTCQRILNVTSLLRFT